MKEIQINLSSTYKKELKKLKRKNYPINLISKCLQRILNDDKKVCYQIKLHQLKGKWKGFYEFHPARISKFSNQKYDQWIVIYYFHQDQLTLTLVTTGNHQILDKHKPFKIIKKG